MVDFVISRDGLGRDDQPLVVVINYIGPREIRYLGFITLLCTFKILTSGLQTIDS